MGERYQIYQRLYVDANPCTVVITSQGKYTLLSGKKNSANVKQQQNGFKVIQCQMLRGWLYLGKISVSSEMCQGTSYSPMKYHESRKANVVCLRNQPSCAQEVKPAQL